MIKIMIIMIRVMILTIIVAFNHGDDVTSDDQDHDYHDGHDSHSHFFL